MGSSGLDTGSEVEDVVATSISGGVLSTITEGTTPSADGNIGAGDGLMRVLLSGGKGCGVAGDETDVFSFEGGDNCLLSGR